MKSTIITKCLATMALATLAVACTPDTGADGTIAVAPVPQGVEPAGSADAPGQAGHGVPMGMRSSPVTVSLSSVSKKVNSSRPPMTRPAQAMRRLTVKARVR